MSKAIVIVRSVIFNVFITFWALVAPCLFVWIVALPHKRVVAAIRVWQSVAIGSAKVLAGIDYRIVGKENIPDGACIIASKHQSAWETCILHVLFDDPAIVLKKELTHIPIWGWFAQASHLIPIDRKGGVKALAKMKKASTDAVKAGRKIVIFPQGTRVKPGQRKPYKAGIVAMYQDLDIPIVPVALNSGVFWPKDSFLKRAGTITIKIMPAIPPGLSRTEMMRRLQAQIEDTSNELANEAFAALAKEP